MVKKKPNQVAGVKKPSYADTLNKKQIAQEIASLQSNTNLGINNIIVTNKNSYNNKQLRNTSNNQVLNIISQNDTDTTLKIFNYTIEILLDPRIFFNFYINNTGDIYLTNIYNINDLENKNHTLVTNESDNYSSQYNYLVKLKNNINNSNKLDIIYQQKIETLIYRLHSTTLLNSMLIEQLLNK